MHNKIGCFAAFRPVLLTLVCALAPIAGDTFAAPPDGDVNMDGQINSADVDEGLQAALGRQALQPGAVPHADVAPLVGGIPVPDGTVDAADVVIMLQMVLQGLYYGYPINQFASGDSISEAQAAATSTIGSDMKYHQHVWSTGYGASVNSYNVRFEAAAPSLYTANSSTLDDGFNHAVSGAVMADFAIQAQGIVADAEALPEGKAGAVAVLLGSNDVCTDTPDGDMTDPQLFEDDLRTGLDVLAASEATRYAQIQITGIPAIYWLWVAKRGDFFCRALIWPFVPCQNLLDNPGEDCVSAASRNDPDNDYENETSDCIRRKTFHRTIRNEYNSRLHAVTDQYREDGLLPNARYVDIYDVQLSSSDITDADCFHPSVDGQAKLAQETWCRTHWGIGDAQCP